MADQSHELVIEARKELKMIGVLEETLRQRRERVKELANELMQSGVELGKVFSIDGDKVRFKQGRGKNRTLNREWIKENADEMPEHVRPTEVTETKYPTLEELQDALRDLPEVWQEAVNVPPPGPPVLELELEDGTKVTL